MTVCIAATSNSLGAVVTVSDTMFSSTERSVDSGPPKVEFVRDRWLCMYAADEPSVYRSVIRSIKARLEGGPANIEDMITATESSYDEARKRRFEREVLRDCFMKHDDFVKYGLKQLGDATFTRKLYEMNQMGLGLELLIGGHDVDLTPHLISSDSFGNVTRHDDLSFHAIGSGAFAALGSLHRNDNFRFADDVVHIVHRLLEAKYCAETSVHVGPDRTIIVALLKNGECAVSFSEIPAARDAWERQRKQEPERSVLEAIDSALDTLSRASNNPSQPVLLLPADQKQIEGHEQTTRSS